jgi:exodeoxyribonuclease VII large subunit
VRAPTPTAAAELAVPVRADLIARLQTLGLRAMRSVTRDHDRATERLTSATRRMPTPDTLLGPQRQRSDDMGERLRRGLGRVAADARGDLARTAGGLRPAILTQRLGMARGRLDQLWRVAASLHPDGPLKRGYARVEKRGGGVVANKGAAQSAGALTLWFADGAVDARVERDAPPAKDKHSPAQPGLFE